MGSTVDNKTAGKPLIAYDYKAFYEANTTEPHHYFFKEGCLDGCFSVQIGEEPHYSKKYKERLMIGKVYSRTFAFSERYYTGEKRKRLRANYLWVTVSQLGVEAVSEFNDFMRAYRIVKGIEDELQKYSFVPKYVELWSDHPEEPYYTAEKRTSCRKVIAIDEYFANIAGGD